MKSFPNKLSLVLMAMLVVEVTGAAAQDSQFPHRSDFPEVQVVGVHDLYAGLDSGEFVVVDVRSRLEFNVIHIKGAKHIAISQGSFFEKVGKLAAANPGKKMAFYCNGTTCLKSYKAAIKAKEAGLTDVYAFDGGIPEWAQVWPQQTVLLDKPIADPQTQLISKADFKAHCLDWPSFQAQAASDGTVVIDVRDKIQNSGALSENITARAFPLDRFIPNFVIKGKHSDKTVLIIDQVGKQVKWLQYYLEEYGYENYYFLDGGATVVLNSQDYKI